MFVDATLDQRETELFSGYLLPLTTSGGFGRSAAAARLFRSSKGRVSVNTRVHMRGEGGRVKTLHRESGTRGRRLLPHPHLLQE